MPETQIETFAMPPVGYVLREFAWGQARPHVIAVAYPPFPARGREPMLCAVMHPAEENLAIDEREAAEPTRLRSEEEIRRACEFKTSGVDVLELCELGRMGEPWRDRLAFLWLRIKATVWLATRRPPVATGGAECR